MMRNFFQSLEKHKVRYLLISGQASVLYGAAQFSEDIDLWIAPTADNLHAFIKALRSMRATIYKLTQLFTSLGFEKYFSRGRRDVDLTRMASGKRIDRTDATQLDKPDIATKIIVRRRFNARSNLARTGDRRKLNPVYSVLVPHH